MFKLRAAYQMYRARGIRAVLRAARIYVTGDAYAREKEVVRNPLYNISEGDLEENARVLSQTEHKREIRSVTWFLPYSASHAMGGRATIYRFASFLHEQRGMRTRFALLSNPRITVEDGMAMLRSHVPHVTKDAVSIIRTIDDIKALPPTDIGIATKWNTAYALLRFNQTRDKFYFVQDFEAAFHPAGTSYGIAEATYRFGFAGIVSTPGLEGEYAAYSDRHISFTPAIDTSVYYHNPSRKPADVLRIVFYGRPSVSRNGFVLGLEALKDVKRAYGDRVCILTAGEDWDPSRYGAAGMVENLGLLHSLSEVAELYRSADIGLALIFTKHTSYQPFEYMASGAAVVMNRNRFGAWLLRDTENCLLAEPSISDIATKIGRLVADQSLRERLQRAGRTSVAHLNWHEQFERVWNFMRCGRNSGR